MPKNVFFALSLLLLAQSAWGFGSKPVPPPMDPIPLPPPPSVEEVGGVHRARYALASAPQKLVDNRGNGFESLYGTRNFRAVLSGVYYRGGANNAYHRTNKRDNMNPLPNDGLQNLCEEGFGHAVYLYSTNYGTAPKVTRCRTFDNAEQTLDYLQVSVANGNAPDLRKLLSLIHDHVRNPRLGPVYMHCWNGWHASGYAAAAALRQFCDFTGEQAVAYWNINTDGVNQGTSYDRIRRMIREFVPYSEFSLSPEEKAALCPDPSTLKFR